MNNTKDQLTKDLTNLKNEFMEIPRSINKLGLNILYPLIPLIGLVVLVLHALL